MGTTHATNGFEKHRDPVFLVCAFEFVQLGVKEIGSSDVFAQIYLQHVKTQSGKDFAEKNDQCRQSITVRGAESEVIRTGRKFSGGGARLKNGPTSSASLS
jgi:hypothetical protein